MCIMHADVFMYIMHACIYVYHVCMRVCICATKHKECTTFRRNSWNRTLCKRVSVRYICIIYVCIYVHNACACIYVCLVCMYLCISCMYVYIVRRNTPDAQRSDVTGDTERFVCVCVCVCVRVWVCERERVSVCVYETSDITQRHTHFCNYVECASYTKCQRLVHSLNGNISFTKEPYF